MLLQRLRRTNAFELLEAFSIIDLGKHGKHGKQLVRIDLSQMQRIKVLFIVVWIEYRVVTGGRPIY